MQNKYIYQIEMDHFLSQPSLKALLAGQKIDPGITGLIVYRI